MVFIIFALVSLLIVIPIVYFLPSMLSVKGKISIVGISFIIANIGPLAQGRFGFWQSLLVLLLLVTLCSFLLVKRIVEPANLQNKKEINHKTNTTLLGYMEENKDLQMDKLVKHPPIQKELIMLTNESLSSEKIDEELPFKKEQIYQDKNSLSSGVKDALKNEESFDNIEEIASLTEADQHSSIIENDSIEFDEDILFLLKRDEDFSTHEIEDSDLIDKSIGTDQEIGYMSEIEKLLKETDIQADENTEYTRVEEVKEMENLEEVKEMENLEEVVIRKNNTKTEIVAETSISDEEVEIEELVFQK